MTELKAKTLGKVEGLCACYNTKTLNGRGYDQIYKNIISGKDYRFNEMMRRGGILCEFGHPSQFVSDFERTETDPEKACVLLTEVKESEGGNIYGKGVILDTPAGRIYSAIAPLYDFGFSSRGSYEADPNSTEGPDGWNQDTYVFKGFDVVLLPANEGSMVSATESVGTHSHFKSARESLDINQIADAASVDKDEVNAELDKLFTKEGSTAPAEIVSLKDYAENQSSEAPQEGQSNILLDLHKVLIDNASLEKQIQKLLFEKAESDASLLALNQQLEELKVVQDNATKQIDFYAQNKVEIQALLDKLLEMHAGFVQQTDEELKSESQKTRSLASQVASLTKDLLSSQDESAILYNQAQRAETAEIELDSEKAEVQKLTKANESLTQSNKELQKTYASINSKYKQATEQLSQTKEQASQFQQLAKQSKLEAAAAKEALLDTYSTLYSIDRQQLISKVGKQASVSVIMSAAESLSKDAVRLSGFTSIPQGRLVSPKSPTRNRPTDDIEAELYAGLEYDSRIEEN